MSCENVRQVTKCLSKERMRISSIGEKLRHVLAKRE